MKKKEEKEREDDLRTGHRLACCGFMKGPESTVQRGPNITLQAALEAFTKKLQALAQAPWYARGPNTYEWSQATEGATLGESRAGPCCRMAGRRAPQERRFWADNAARERGAERKVEAWVCWAADEMLLGLSNSKWMLSIVLVWIHIYLDTPSRSS